MKISIKTLGCKLNQAESDELKETLQKEGFFVIDWGGGADVYIINACSLTHGAEQGTRQIIRQACRQNPKAKNFVTGCFGQKMPEVDFYNKNQKELVKKIKAIARSRTTKQSRPIKNNGIATLPTVARNDTYVSQSRTRALIKIQTGCDNHCSFCIIPHFRGQPQSLRAQDIIKKIKSKIKQGHKEIVLTGVNICKYKDNKINLSKLAKKILKETAIPRIRFGSLDPYLIDDEFIFLLDNPRVMPHMHLSLQSGSNKILKAMNRKYTAGQYLSLVQKIRKKFPYLGFTTDAIVGFPDETKKDFKDTCDFVRKAEFLKIHIFPYSKRAGTSAAKFPQIDEKIKKGRFSDLNKISESLSLEFKKKMIGQSASVLFEEKRNNNWIGYAPNYLRLKLKSKENLKNKIKDITISPQNLF